MAKVPIKFRCIQCNQLLGASRSKVGSVISCPRCSAELIVPEVDDPSEISRAPEDEPIPSILASIVLGPPDPLLELRPEDIRVEPGLIDLGRGPRASYPVVLPSTWSTDPPDPPPPPLVITREAIAPPPVEEPSQAVEPILPPIETEPVAIRAARTSGRSRDVTLPRSVVAAWSLFVLLALAMAFAAGLLAGHFLWRVH